MGRQVDEGSLAVLLGAVHFIFGDIDLPVELGLEPLLFAFAFSTLLARADAIQIRNELSVVEILVSLEEGSAPHGGWALRVVIEHTLRNIGVVGVGRGSSEVWKLRLSRDFGEGQTVLQHAGVIPVRGVNRRNAPGLSSAEPMMGNFFFFSDGVDILDTLLLRLGKV
eukprot:CAMPEP_0170505132 /NCGR_PEP_ID=MMETSP0208-20121228/49943_1 /TAXON_ID=197538 /ORGANISM="Strombidium inclinatum, Strain S3" /LENGTH=166 /DNA_ID=CAMNT_0010785791 /DNA_START=739 /DNA_END=1239 /DNA_ORIENTATION=+